MACKGKGEEEEEEENKGRNGKGREDNVRERMRRIGEKGKVSIWTHINRH